MLRVGEVVEVSRSIMMWHLLCGAYFAISESAIADVVKRRLLFLFLPRKEKTVKILGWALGRSTISEKSLKAHTGMPSGGSLVPHG